MTIKRGDRFKTPYELYEVAGKWLGDIVLAPVNTDKDECLIYSTGEIEDLIQLGKFVMEDRCSR